LSPLLPSAASHQRDWRGLEAHKGRDGRSCEGRKRPSYLSHDCQRLLDLRGESLRIRATAKPIITSTPKITSARFTGRDYVRASADLHNRAEICTGGRGLESPLFPNAKEKAPFFPSTEQFLLATGLSTLDSLHNPLRKDIHSQSVLRFPLIFNLPSPHGFFYPRRAGIFSPIGPRSLTHLCKIL